MKRIALFILAFYFTTPLLAQERAKMVFENTIFSFGKIEEKKGKVSYDFKFTNAGEKPLLVRHIESSCGCIVSKWNRKPIAPGESGVITVVLNPKNIGGRFNKKIIVFTNSAGEPNLTLRLTGEVVAQPVDIANEFPVKIGSLRLNRDELFVDVFKPQPMIVLLLNNGKKEINISSIAKPDYIRVDYTPLILLPGMQGNLIINYTPTDNHILSPGDQIIIRTTEGEEGKLTLK